MSLTRDDARLRRGELAGRPRLIPVPVLTPQLSSYWLALVTTVPASIARALIGGLKHDIPGRRAPLRRWYRSGADVQGSGRRALAAERTQTVRRALHRGRADVPRGRHEYAYYAKRAAGQRGSARHAGANLGHRHTGWAAMSATTTPRRCGRIRAWNRLAGWRAGVTKGPAPPDELRIGDTHATTDGDGARSGTPPDRSTSHARARRRRDRVRDRAASMRPGARG